MYRMEIARAVFYDSLPLARQGQLFTANSLKYLYSRLVKARTYVCGDEKNLLPLRLKDPPPTLFLKEEKALKPLPERDMLLEFTAGDKNAAGLFSTAHGGLELFIFRFDTERNRWMWPFIGMCYGPEESAIHQIAVLEPRGLSAMSTNAKNAMVQEHARDAALLIAALEEIRKGVILPVEERDNESALGKGTKPTISPSSLARKARTQHKRRGQSKGARRL
ncbi:MAG: hypothetical protein K5657_02460 [Desulfovibrio sp.]|nr:hypothetical protein [Desulfovibrio sp.]